MTLSTLYIGNYGTIVYSGHAGFLVSTVVLWAVVKIAVSFLGALNVRGQLGEFQESFGGLSESSRFWYYSRANLPFRVSHNGKALGIFGEPAIPDAIALFITQLKKNSGSPHRNRQGIIHSSLGLQPQ